MELLERLCNAHGVSGDTDAVAEIIIDEIMPFCEKIEVMNEGNIIAYKKGRQRNPKKVMLCAHMDEVGFLVKDITEDGYLRFESVGGIDERILLSQKVRIGDSNIPGVVGVKAVHMATKEEREKTIKMEKLYIDTGVYSRREIEELVEKGDSVKFDSEFVKFGENKIKAKAIDDRVGVRMLIEMIKKEVSYDFVAAFVVNEEIGTQGSKTAAYRVSPDIALILEGTTCSDVPGTKPHEQSTNQGEGPAISIVDRTSYSNRALNDFLVKLAQENDVKYQFKRTTMGGNDAGSIAVNGTGVKTAVVSMPVRYIHSPASVMDLRDYEEGLKLVSLFVDNIGGFKDE